MAQHRGHLAARRGAAPAPRRDRHLRRRPPRPPGGDQRGRHGAHLRPASARGDPPGGAAEADHALRVKRDVIEGLGVSELVVIPFDEEFAQRSAEDFIEQVLVEKLGAEQVSVGENFRFGAKAKGDPEMLAAPRRSSRPGSCRWSRSTARPSPRPGSGPWSRPVTWRRRGAASARRSWSRARWSAATSAAASSASRPPTSSPTTASSIPGHGVYAAFANGVPAAVNVGVRPTFESGRGVLIETYLIDLEEDLYGTEPAGRLRRPAARREALRRGSRS